MAILPMVAPLVAGSLAAAPPPRHSQLLDTMLSTFPSNRWQFTSTMNAALCVLPNNQTAAYFTCAAFPAAIISKLIYMTTSTDHGATFSPPVLQAGPVPWYAAVLNAAQSVYEVPQCLLLPAGPNGPPSTVLMWQAYPLGLRAGRADWNATSGTFEWPRHTADLVVVDQATDGGINRPPIRLRTGRLFHIGAGANMPGGCKGVGVMGAYSDPPYALWHHSATNLTVPLPLDVPNPSCGEADEPVTVELSNGTLWTLIRTNAGGGETMALSTLWEAFSDDGGAHWRGAPRPSSLISWSSPAAVLRLDRSAGWGHNRSGGGKPPILVLWTNARTTQDYRLVSRFEWLK